MQNLTETLGKVAKELERGLSLANAAALHGVLRRPLVSWVRLADDGVEPFQAWLMAICQRDAQARAQYFDGLGALSALDVGAVRDYRRARGAPTELERELILIRRDAKHRTARLDARKLQRDLGL